LSYNRFRQTAINLAAETLWHTPGCFGIARMFGPSYSLRCVVFHNVSAVDSPFTRGMSVSISPTKFEAALRFLTTHYTPVRLEDVLADSDGRGLPPRAVLVTFDDAYASVAESAAPLCRKFGVPAVFFVNAAFLDNQRLAPDNLVCYVANVLGMETIRSAARAVRGSGTLELHSLSEVFTRFFPAISLAEREVFLEALRQLAGIDESRMAQEAGLYLTSKQLRDLASFDFEIGNHTYSHVHCRSLSREEFGSQVHRNKAELESLSGTKVRSFSQPYGSSTDLTRDLAEHLEYSAHKAVFLSESVANPRGADPFHLDRVSTRAESDDTLFFELEVLPRLRAVRNRLYGFAHRDPAMQVATERTHDDRVTAGRKIELKFMRNPGWHVEVDHATPLEWSGMLDLFEDANIYQTSAYGEVRWGEKNLSRLVLKRDGEVVGIAQLRIIRPTPLKFGMAYLRWGPLWERRCVPLDPEVPARMARAIEEEYLEKRKLFLRVLPNAFAGSPRARAMQAAFSRFTTEPLDAGNTYRTFVLDLSPSLEELRKGFDPKWRNKLSGAEKNELNVISGNGSTKYHAFCRIYNQMRRRKTFETTVDVDEFGRIQETLGESQRMRILICEDKGVPVAGLVVSAMGDSAIYLLGATSDDGLKSKGAYLLQWTMIQWLKENGIRWYDLGGIDPEGNPGVYSFKRGLSGVDLIQINPLVASESAVSSGIVKAGLAMQHTLRGSLSSLKLARSLKQMATRN
jgi:lipid II:glycine glycyltransferase (peptidoglycan interpeptide bridge formation enzyme)/peptidoglycan/xylan/chitin deacetylase (PgdA/CDA1 family)